METYLGGLAGASSDPLLGFGPFLIEKEET